MLLFRHRLARAGGLAAAAAATAAAGVTAASAAAPPPGKGTPSALPAAVLVYEPKSEETVENWSATHSASPVAYFSPETAAGVQHILALMHEAGQRLRVVGSALSPNGIGLSDENMLNMVQLDKVVSIDKEKKVYQFKKMNYMWNNYPEKRKEWFGGYDRPDKAYIHYGCHG